MCSLQQDRVDFSVPYYRDHKKSCHVSFTLSFRLNSLLVGVPQKFVNEVQCLMHCAARLVSKAPKREHVTSVLLDLHRLPVGQ